MFAVVLPRWFATRTTRFEISEGVGVAAAVTGGAVLCCGVAWTRENF